MRNRKQRIAYYLAGIVILFAAVTFANYRYASQNPGGSDFLVHWMGTRAYLTEGVSPYSDEVALMIQNMAYGRPAQAGEHELRVAYPLYSMIVFAPFAAIPDFTLARAVWMTVLEIGIFALTYLCLKLVGWKPGVWTVAGLFLFSIFWYHGLRPLINGNAVVLVALALVGVLIFMRDERDELAGVLLAFSTIKPQLVLIPIVLILFWCLTKKRWKLIGWFGVTMFILVAAATLLIPTWLLQNLAEVIRYPSYNPPGTIQAAMQSWWGPTGVRIGQVVSILLALILLLEWRSVKKYDFRGFLWVFCLSLVISQWIGIQTDPGNFIILFPALILTLALWVERWRKVAKYLVPATLLGLFVLIWVLFVTTIEHSYQPIQSPVMFVPLPVFLFLMLYWVRWWALHPPLGFTDGILRENV